MSLSSTNLPGGGGAIFFYGHRRSKEGHDLGLEVLSQFYPVSFTDPTDTSPEFPEGRLYSSSEQYMHAQKARLFGDEKHLQLIMSTRHCAAIKQWGRAVRGFDATKWEACRFEIVLQGNRLKFGQNPALGRVLLGTKSETLYEAAPKDAIWGIGMSASAAAARLHLCRLSGKRLVFPGLNLLGRALMTVRTELRTAQEPRRVTLALPAASSSSSSSLSLSPSPTLPPSAPSAPSANPVPPDSSSP